MPPRSFRSSPQPLPRASDEVEAEADSYLPNTATQLPLLPGAAPPRRPRCRHRRLLLGRHHRRRRLRVRLQGRPLRRRRRGREAPGRGPTHAAGNQEFRAEVEVLGALQHPNLARLLGFCAAGRDWLLIYELLEHGSVEHWLHEAEAAALPWGARLRAARGAAGALAFLYHGYWPPVLHRDIKAGNVLLDAYFEVRLADFGLARLVQGSPAASHVSTQDVFLFSI